MRYFAPCSLVPVVAMCPTFLHAQSLPVTRIADSSTLVPGTAFTFDRFGLPASDGQTIGFSGFRDFSPTNAGMYRGAGASLEVIADRTTPIPAGTGNFVSFSSTEQYWPSLDGASTAFIGDGAGTSFIQRGIYLRDPGGLTRVIDRSTPVPNGGGGNFFNIGPPSLTNGRVAFSAREFGDAQRGIYSWQNSSLSVIADRSTPMPQGPGNFTGFSDWVSLDDGELAFSGFRNSFWGIYSHSQAFGLTRLYDNTTLVPGTSEPFVLMSQASLSNGHVAFYGGGAGVTSGIYADFSGALAAVVDTTMIMPGRPGIPFGGFGHLDLDGQTVAFMGFTPGGATGVYFSRAGALHKVLAAGDAFDGRTVFDVFMGPQGLSGDYLAFQVRFTNGDWGIYRATIPAPAALAPLALACLVASRRRRDVAHS